MIIFDLWFGFFYGNKGRSVRIRPKGGEELKVMSRASPVWPGLGTVLVRARARIVELHL